MGRLNDCHKTSLQLPPETNVLSKLNQLEITIRPVKSGKKCKTLTVSANQGFTSSQKTNCPAVSHNFCGTWNIDKRAGQVSSRSASLTPRHLSPVIDRDWYLLVLNAVCRNQIEPGARDQRVPCISLINWHVGINISYQEANSPAR